MRLAKQIQTFKAVLLLIVAVFSLLPCTTKASIWATIGIDYEKPLNRVKVSSSLSGCSKTVEAIQIAGSQHKIQCHYDVLSEVQMITCTSLWIYDEKVSTPDFSVNHVNAPPKYILYKRLKIAVV